MTKACTPYTTPAEIRLPVMSFVSSWQPIPALLRCPIQEACCPFTTWLVGDLPLSASLICCSSPTETWVISRMTTETPLSPLPWRVNIQNVMLLSLLSVVGWTAPHRFLPPPPRVNKRRILQMIQTSTLTTRNKHLLPCAPRTQPTRQNRLHGTQPTIETVPSQSVVCARKLPLLSRPVKPRKLSGKRSIRRMSPILRFSS
mmetsp:Transcript_5684/g.7999  ORF Transcript_5684/g.7999 Transcript_5684/m.7999 type:complete len:201 (+) Transcript_5684:424-1026(+)